MNWFNFQIDDWDEGPQEQTVESYLPYIGENNAKAIFFIRVNHQGYDVKHAYANVMSLLAGVEYCLKDEHKI